MTPTIYLAGSYKDDEYRIRAKSLLGNYTLLDPFRPERDFRGREDEPNIEVEVVEGDLDDINSCDALLSNFSTGGVGTNMENWYAYSIGRPIYAFVDLGRRRSPWVKYIAHEGVHDTLESAVSALVKDFPLA